ncbi:hypothetical protein MKX03_021486 [Papaver bracteatum]|nr:hypothetical protein MKX03_021486 [Papaver bracteatum]
MKKAIEAGKARTANGMRQELMRVPNDPYHTGKSNDELDELSASVQRIGGVGLIKHEELTGQVEFLIVIPFVRLNYCLVCWNLKILGY